jgi:hypothetical protein
MEPFQVLAGIIKLYLKRQQIKEYAYGWVKKLCFISKNILSFKL